MSNAPPVLHILSALTFSGTDARSYLQGQLSHDLRKLTPDKAQLTSCNSAQGRVQAVLTLIERDGQIIALLPPTLRSRLLPRLKNYILRAKVQLLDDPALWTLSAMSRQCASEAFATLPEQPGDVVHAPAGSLLRWWSHDERYLLLTPGAASEPVNHNDDSGVDACLIWRRADIAAGLPQVYPETHESFVAQMLNLDALHGISFNKGCYTGQEIIARTHYRGTIKRRMLRYRADCSAPDPGTRIVSDGNPAGEVVDSVDTENGCELLAVMSLELATSPGLVLQDMPSASLSPLSLPYELPVKEATLKAVQPL